MLPLRLPTSHAAANSCHSGHIAHSSAPNASPRSFQSQLVLPGWAISMSFLKLCRLYCLGTVERGGAGIGCTEFTHLLALLEVIAAVGPQHVGEVAHQSVVLLGLVTGPVGHVVLIVVEPFRYPVVLFPGRAIRRDRIEA